MTAPALADCYVPVPIPWRHVRPGDVIVGADGTLWNVWGSRPFGDTWSVDVFGMNTQHRDPDALVRVLTSVPERDAAHLARDLLGAQLIERRTA